MSPGEKRRRRAKRERENAIYTAQLSALKEAGASCASCPEFGTAPVSKQRICKLHSDFYGYEITTADGLCTDYHGRLVPGARSVLDQEMRHAG